MMEIFWTMLASQDRKRIREYIAEQNLMAAIELDERIGYSASSLAGQPYKGRNGRVEGTRELVIHPHFVLVYEVDSQWGKSDRDHGPCRIIGQSISLELPSNNTRCSNWSSNHREDIVIRLLYTVVSGPDGPLTQRYI